MPKTERTTFDMVGLLMGHHPSYEALLATAIIVGEGLYDGMTAADMKRFTNMVDNVADIMRNCDEPRFCLYDYLDACVNTNDKDWRDLAHEFEVAVQTERTYTAEKHLIALAEAKRNTYTEE